jgi:hypothetical protein
MPPRFPAAVLWVTCILSCASARAADPPRPVPASDPDPSFLEFLGSVDNLADTNPDYLAQANLPHAPSPGTPPPSKPAPPPPAPGGAKNNE